MLLQNWYIRKKIQMRYFDPLGKKGVKDLTILELKQLFSSKKCKQLRKT